MIYAITPDGLRELNRYLEARETLEDFLGSNIMDALDVKIHQNDVLIEDFNDLLKDLGRDDLIRKDPFSHSQDRLEFSIKDLEKTERDAEDTHILLDDLFEQGWLERLELDFLGEVRELLNGSYNLSAAIAEAMAGKDKGLVIEEIWDGGHLGNTQKIEMVWLIENITAERISMWDNIVTSLTKEA